MAAKKTPKPEKGHHRIASGTCIFCGPTNDKISSEHIWPRWISALFHKRPRKDQYQVVRADAFLGDTVFARNVFRSASLDSRVNVVCETCNNNWMSDLEHHTKPLLSSLIKGRLVRYLSIDDLVSLNAWAMKMALVFEHSSKYERFYTQAERETFRESLLPTYGTSIWIARYQGRVRASCQMHNLTYELPFPVGTCRGKVITLAVGQLAIQILSGRWPKNATAYAPPIWDSATRHVWPIPNRLPVRWPPPQHLDDSGLQDFSYRWSRDNVRLVAAKPQRA